MNTESASSSVQLPAGGGRLHESHLHAGTDEIEGRSDPGRAGTDDYSIVLH